VVRSATVFDNVGMKVSVPDKDKIFLAPQTQSVQVAFTNANNSPFTGTVHVKITTDDFKPLQQLKQTVTLAEGRRSLQKPLTTNQPFLAFIAIRFTWNKAAVPAGQKRLTSVTSLKK
jgi:hypothetical protein